MRLKDLLPEENDGSVLNVLKTTPWYIYTRSELWNGHEVMIEGDSHHVFDFIDQLNKKVIQPSEFKMTVTFDNPLGWDIGNDGKFKILKDAFHPHLDLPKQESNDFHDDDEFGDDRPAILSYFFTIAHDYVSANADVYDENEKLKLTPEIETWMREHFNKYLNIINKQLKLR